MKVTNVAMAAFLVFAAISASTTGAAEGPSTRPSVSPGLAKFIDDSLSKLADGSDDEKQLAEDRLFNAPLSAFPLIEAGLKRPGIGVEPRQRLERIVDRLQPIVKKQEAASEARRKEYAWNQRTALEAYDRAGRHDPKWDDLARQAIRLMTSHLAADKPAAFVAVQHLTNDLTCDDPLIQYMEARNLAESAAHEADPAKVARVNSLAVDEFTASCDGFEKSDYPAGRKCFALTNGSLMIMNTAAKNVPALKTKARAWADEAMDLVPAMVKEPGVPERWLTEVPDLIVQAELNCGADRGAAVDQMFPALIQALPDRPGPLVFKAHHYTDWAWDARGGGFANTVTPEGWKRMAQRLADAEDSLTKAYELDPKDPAAAAQMITVELGQGKGRAVMEKWFKRAIEADPESVAAYHAKMYYLEPKWYGSPQDMIDFGHQCLATRDWRGDVTWLLVQAHVALAAYAPDQNAYWRDPKVWPDVQSVVARAAEIYPENIHTRTLYAYWAWKCGSWDIADAQFKLLGDKADLSVFQNRRELLDAARTEVAKNVQPH